MDWPTFIQTIANSIVASSIYASIAVGLALCFGVMQMANFAHGEFFMLGAYVVFVLNAMLGLPYPFVVLLAALFVGFVGLVVEQTIFKRTRGNVLAGFMATAGLGMILQVIVGQLWGFALMKTIPTPYPETVSILGAQIGVQRLLIVPGAILSVGLLWYFLHHSRIGKGLRACAQDQEAAALQGISVVRMGALAMVLAGMLAGFAGALMAPVHAVTPYMGHAVVLTAFIVVVVGGMASVEGAIVASILFGFVHTFAATIFDSVVASMIGVVVMIVVLVAKPKGLMGRAKA